MFDNLSNYFDEAARAILKEGVSAWHMLKRQEVWQHWLRVGKAIATAQDIAASVTGQTSGRNFNAFMAACYAKPSYLGEFAEIDASTRSYAAKCWREREAIAKWRQKIGQAKALQMNHPKVVWQAFEASRRSSSGKSPPVASPYERLKAENADLKAQLAGALPASDGSRKASTREQELEKALEKARHEAEMARGLLASADARCAKLQEEIAELRKAAKAASSAEEQRLHRVVNDLRGDNAALRREVKELQDIAALPAESAKRYRAHLTRARGKDRREVNAHIRELEELKRDAIRRSGKFTEQQWHDIQLCVHPDSNPSAAVKHRAFLVLEQRKKALT